MESDRDECIATYFEDGFTYKEIGMLLKFRHGITLSERQIKRDLKKMGLSRKFDKTAIGTVADAIIQEIDHGSGSAMGYRSMHGKITKVHGLKTDHETIRRLLSVLDPEGVHKRSTRRLQRRQYTSEGSNYIWHIDGWDKLTPYGLTVHGCLDGFSRRILWLKAGSSNKNSMLICKYFCDCVKNVNGIPKIVRADRGTENVKVELLQTVLRSVNDDCSCKVAFLYGKSTANQRIESFWSKFPIYGAAMWISHCRQLLDVGIIDNSNILDIECMRYCYMDLLQRELDTTQRMWNTHHIQKSKSVSSVNGKPDILYFAPEEFGHKDVLQKIDQEIFAQLESDNTCVVETNKEHFKELFQMLMEESGKSTPNTLEEARELLVFLLDKINHELQQ